VVGDRLDSDLAGAAAAGLDGAIVLTGVTDRASADAAHLVASALARGSRLNERGLRVSRGHRAQLGLEQVENIAHRHQRLQFLMR